MVDIKHLFGKCSSKEEIIALKMFFRFLKQKKIRQSFLRNGQKCVENRRVSFEILYQQNIDNFYDLLIVRNKNIHTRLCLISSFAWAETDEGFAYWEKINTEWNKYYEKQIR